MTVTDWLKLALLLLMLALVGWCATQLEWTV